VLSTRARGLSWAALARGAGPELPSSLTGRKRYSAGQGTITHQECRAGVRTPGSTKVLHGAVGPGH
jgi:hypothetical protein